MINKIHCSLNSVEFLSKFQSVEFHYEQLLSTSEFSVLEVKVTDSNEENSLIFTFSLSSLFQDFNQ